MGLRGKRDWTYFDFDFGFGFGFDYWYQQRETLVLGVLPNVKPQREWVGVLLSRILGLYIGFKV